MEIGQHLGEAASARSSNNPKARQFNRRFDAYDRPICEWRRTGDEIIAATRGYCGLPGEGSIPVPLPPPLSESNPYLSCDCAIKPGCFSSFFGPENPVASRSRPSTAVENGFFSA